LFNEVIISYYYIIIRLSILNIAWLLLLVVAVVVVVVVDKANKLFRVLYKPLVSAVCASPQCQFIIITITIPNVPVKCLALLLHILEILSQTPDPEIGNSD
jgi:hypothetical protein